jgi:hypothetical protein
MKQQEDQGCSEHQFAEGNQVFLRIQPYKKKFLKEDHCQKLAPKFYGPYIVRKCMGQVSYQLSFPSNSKLHPIFHVSCLKKVIGSSAKLKPAFPSWTKKAPFGYSHKRFWTSVSILYVK